MSAGSSSRKHCSLLGELVIERAFRRARVADDVGDRGGAVAALTDRGGQPVEQPEPERVGVFENCVDGR